MRTTLVLAVLVSGCRCQPVVQATHASFAWAPSPALQVSGREATLEFGRVLRGEAREQLVRLENTGSGQGDFHSVVSPTAPFSALVEAQTVGGGFGVDIPLRFTPVDDARLETREVSDELVIEVDGESASSGPLRLKLHGVIVSVGCAIPETLDFGAVKVGETRQRTLSMENPTSEAMTARWSTLREASGASVAFSWDNGPGERLISPVSMVTLTASFTPPHEGEYLALAEVQPATPCRPKSVRMRGRGVSGYLSWAPLSVDCGHVPVGLTASREVRLSNSGPTPISVSNLRVEGGHAEVDGMSEIQLAAESQHTVTVVCAPADVGPVSSSLRFDTDAPMQPGGVVPIRMVGGGPDIEVQPIPLQFGRVPLVGGATLRTSRVLSVRNVGTLEASTDGNLHLGDGGSGLLTLTSVESGWSSALVDSYDADAGLAARAGALLRFRVELTPQRLGLAEAIATLSSNDLDEPVINIPISAEVVSAPPCRFEVAPNAVHFGVMEEGVIRTSRVRFTNIGTTPAEVCFVSGVAIDAAGLRRGFSIVNDAPIEVSAGASHDFVVRFQGVISGLSEGLLEFSVSSPSTPQVTLPLSATVGEVCIAARPVEFPVTAVGCESSQQLAMYNLCPYSVSLHSLALNGPAPFAIVSQPDAGLTLAPTDVAQAELKFAPTSLGDAGVELHISYRGHQPLLLVTPVAGTAITPGAVTESIRVPAVPQSDILLTADDFGVGNDPFNDVTGILYDALMDAGVDFHLGFIASCWDYSHDAAPGSPEQTRFPTFGSLLTPDGGSVRFVDRQTQNGRSLARSLQDFSGLARTGLAGCNQGNYNFESFRRALSFEADSGFFRDGVPTTLFMLMAGYPETSTPIRPYLPGYFAGGRVDGGGSVDYYFNEFQALRPGLVRVSALINEYPCGVPTFEPDGGRVHTLAARTGGVVFNQCSPDWVTSLREFQRLSISTQRRFPLSGVPDLAQPFIVSIDGAPVSNWTYQPTMRAIEFTAPPPADAGVSVTYTPKCQ